MNKSSNISKWIFGVLALISVVVTVLFFLKGIPECEPWQKWFNMGLPEGLEPSTPITDILMYWSFAKVILGVLFVLIAALVAAVVKGVNVKTILIILGAIVVIGAVSFFISRGSFYTPYIDHATHEVIYPLTGVDPKTGEGGVCLTHGLIEWGMNFFYITLGVSIITIIYSAIRSSVK